MDLEGIIHWEYIILIYSMRVLSARQSLYKSISGNKFGDFCRGQPEGSLFNSYYPKV